MVISGETDEIAIGALTLELVSIQPYSFEHYFNALKPDTIDEDEEEEEEDDDTDRSSNRQKSISSRNPWFNEFWEHRFGCSLTSSSTCINHRLNETNWDSKLQFIVDATYVFAQALHIYFNCTSTMCFNKSFNNINGTRLFQIILEKTFASKSKRSFLFFFSHFLPDVRSI